MSNRDQYGRFTENNPGKPKGAKTKKTLALEAIKAVEGKDKFINPFEAMLLYVDKETQLYKQWLEQVEQGKKPAAKPDMATAMSVAKDIAKYIQPQMKAVEIIDKNPDKVTTLIIKKDND